MRVVHLTCLFRKLKRVVAIGAMVVFAASSVSVAQGCGRGGGGMSGSMNSMSGGGRGFSGGGTMRQMGMGQMGMGQMGGMSRGGQRFNGAQSNPIGQQIQRIQMQNQQAARAQVANSIAARERSNAQYRMHKQQGASSSANIGNRSTSLSR